jgi:transitional endoplasmic reticulum ATPase
LNTPWKIAVDTPGYVGSDLARICFDASMWTIREAYDLIDARPDAIYDELQTMAVTMDHFRSALSAYNPSALREFMSREPAVSWENIGGLEEAKQHLQETVQYPVDFPQKFHEFAVSSSSGILLYGPPGAGKTLLAKAIAKKCNINFIGIEVRPSLLIFA